MRRIATSLIWVALALITGLLAISEWQVHRLATQHPAVAQVQIAQAGLPYGPRDAAAARLMHVCDDAFRAPTFALQPPAVQQKIAAECSSRAAATLSRSGAQPLAHLVLASRSGPEALHHLDHAHALAPAQAWMAMRRLETAIETLGPETLAPGGPVARELRPVLLSPDLHPSLARAYLRHAALRPLVTEAAEALRMPMQHHFAKAVRAARGRAE